MDQESGDRSLGSLLAQGIAHELDGVHALADMGEDRLQLGRELPDAGLGRRCQLHGCELLQPPDQQMPVDAHEIALVRADAQIDPAVLRRSEQRPVQSGEAVTVHLAAELLLQLQFALPA